MSKNIRTQMNKVVGKSLNAYYQRVKPTIDDIKFKEQYQGRIIDCMVGEVDDNYIETPETDSAIVKLEHSKEGVVKIPSIKGKTILVDAEGNETDTPGEGCRLVSVGEDEDNKMIILSKNKNLLNPSNIINRVWMDVNGNLLQSSDNYMTDFIRVEKDKIYKNNAGFTFYWLFDENKNFIQFQSNNSFVTSGNATYIKFGKSFSLANGATFDFSDKIICEVTNMSDTVHFVSHQYHKTEILLDEPLRSVGSVHDEISGKQYIKKVTCGVINNPRFSIYGTVDRFENTVMILTGRLKGMKHSSSIIADCLPTLNHWNRDTKGIFIDGDVNIHIPKEELETIDEQGIKKWFTENPIQVTFELEEPIIEELPNGITLQGFDETTMYIENSITPIVQYGYNALIPYKEELSKQKEEVETNTLDIEQNIIPYLMDMEFNLMLMEDNE